VGAKSAVDQIKAKLMLNHEVSSNAMPHTFIAFLFHFVDAALLISHWINLFFTKITNKFKDQLAATSAKCDKSVVYSISPTFRFFSNFLFFVACLSDTQ